MTRRCISSGSEFESIIGYSRAVVDGEFVFVSGTTGYNYTTMEISDDVAEQTRQCLENIQHALSDADSNMNDVVRVTYILPNKHDFPKCWPVLQTYFGNIRPAATMFEAGLMNDEMKIEIQVTARTQKNP